MGDFNFNAIIVIPKLSWKFTVIFKSWHNKDRLRGNFVLDSWESSVLQFRNAQECHSSESPGCGTAPNHSESWHSELWNSDSWESSWFFRSYEIGAITQFSVSEQRENTGFRSYDIRSYDTPRTSGWTAGPQCSLVSLCVFGVRGPKFKSLGDPKLSDLVLTGSTDTKYLTS